MAAFTISRNSTLRRQCDLVVEIPAYTDRLRNAGSWRPTLPSRALFEHAVLVLGDALVVPLAQRRGIPTDKPFPRHANLE